MLRATALPFGQQTAGIFVGLASIHAERLLELKQPYSDATTFKLGNQILFTETGKTEFNVNYDPLVLDLIGDGVNLTAESVAAPMRESGALVLAEQTETEEHPIMSVMPLFLLRFAAVAAMALGLAACGRSETYRYKLTLVVNTPDGVKRGSSVCEVKFYDVFIPERGTMHKLRGEALYLDLGPGARPLVALLTSRLHSKWRKDNQGWGYETGPTLGLLLSGVLSKDFMDDVARLAHMRVARKINPTDLPDLVTFADVNDPKSVIEVDPNNLEATLGPNISWNEIILESTDEPITKGIIQKLPWIPAYRSSMLDGEHYRSKNTLANALNTADFDQSDDSKESGK